MYSCFSSGPFQNQDYFVPEACLKYRCHYIDLADARAYVKGIDQFDIEAKSKGLLICSGASSVPGLSSAVIDYYLKDFKKLDSVNYAIATAQLTNQGLATTAGVLSYAGKPFTTIIDGQKQTLIGWQDLKLKKFWKLNKRFLGNCDIPDLEIFPKRYPQLKTLRFQAGLELKFVHLMLYLLSWLVRLKLLKPLNILAPYLLKISHWFDYFGHDNTGFQMVLTGIDHDNRNQEIQFDICAQNGDGLYIPCIPAILLAEGLVEGTIIDTGAMPCVGLIKLDPYLNKLKDLKLNIVWRDQIRKL